MKKLSLLALLPLFLLVSCNSDSTILPSDTGGQQLPPGEENGTQANITIEAKNEGETYSPDEVMVTETLHSLEEKKFYNTRVLPSTGDVNILVIPVLIPGYTSFSYAGLPETMSDEDKQEHVKDDIEKAFFGEASDTGFESLTSFYEKSSFGKLHLGGIVTDWYDAQAEYGLTSPSQLTTSNIYGLVEDAVQWAFRTQGITPSDYDSDEDGFYDGVWLVYSAEDYTKNGPMTDDMNYWAYTSWGNQDKNPNPGLNQYYYNLFGWASYDFMYESYENKIDSHTFIHETGHFLGLNDYYSDRMMYNPVGKVDMMDANIIDLNSYSKMLLGWTKPYIVTGSGSVNIKSMENENCLIVIPSDEYDSGANFDPFSEYILVELYEPSGLNYQDSVTQISSDRPLAPSEPGVRIYHIDNRKLVASTAGYSSHEYEGGELTDDERFITPITNNITPDQYYYYNGVDISYYPYDEIRLIEANKENTFSYGGFQTQETYFHDGDTFSLADYQAFFLKDTFNNDEAFSKEVTVASIVR